MPDWLVQVGGWFAGGGVGALSAFLIFRAKSKDDKQELINQLQEERAFAGQQIDKLVDQIDKLWRDKAASRDHVAQLRDHIWQRKDPPPPEPGEGYIH